MNSTQAQKPRGRATRQLRQWILSGTLQAGETIPAERPLAARLGVSRKTLRIALQTLESEGLIRPDGPRTRVVCRPPVSRTLETCVAVLCVQALSSTTRREGGWLEFINYGAIHALRERGMNVLTVQPPMPDAPSHAVQSLFAEPPAGVIVTDVVERQTEFQMLIDSLRPRGVPVAILSDEPSHAWCDRVVSDHEAGAYELTRWMIARGCRRIVNVWPKLPERYWMRGRLAGYQRAMREAGREPEPVQWIDPLFVGSKESDIFEPKTRFSAGYLAPLLTASEPVDGILAISDGEALPLAAACRLFGKVPNRDVFIGGYDNYVGDLPELEIDPSALAATVDKLNWKVGEALASLLLDRMAGTLPPEPQKRVVRPRLVVRQHTSEES